MDESTTFSPENSENVDPPMSLDDAARAYVTDESQDETTVEKQEPDAINGEGEPDDITLGDDEETEGQDEPGEPETLLANDDMVVEIDGEKVSVKDLKGSRFMEKDYTQGKQALAQERGQLREIGTNFQTALERVSQYLYSKLPPEPDSQLAFTNPQLHYQQDVLHKAALAELTQILQVHEGAAEAVNTVNDADFRALMSAEDQNIVKNLPHLKDPKRFEAFNRRVETRAKEAGFDEAAIKTTADARLRQVFYESALYREARANADKAKVKVQAAPPILPAKQKPNAASLDALARVNAMRKLEQDGSMDSAVRAYMG